MLNPITSSFATNSRSAVTAPLVSLSAFPNSSEEEANKRLAVVAYPNLDQISAYVHASTPSTDLSLFQTASRLHDLALASSTLPLVPVVTDSDTEETAEAPEPVHARLVSAQ